MTYLLNSLLLQIKQTGPITVADYMNICLLHPKHGYYSKQDPFGKKGDFITSPEISQVFGELLGTDFVARRISAIRVPRPGPASTREKGSIP